jgi:hypothetical protein
MPPRRLLMLTPHKLLRPNEAHVAAKVLDGEAIIINLSNGTYYSTDKVGGLIWEMIELGHGLEATVAAITARYEVSQEQAQADVQRLAGELIQEGLVIVSDKPASPAERQERVDGQRLPYEPPSLNIYRDMSDLLALDPPMPMLDEIPWKESSEEPSR